MPRLLLPCAVAFAIPLTAQNTGIALSNLVDGYLDVAYAPQRAGAGS